MEWLTVQRRTQPGAPALHDEHRSWTYKELYEIANALAGSIRRSANLSESGIVAIFLPNSAQYVMLVHAIRFAGCTVFPIHITHKQHELRKSIEHVRPNVIITDSEHAPMVRQVISGDQVSLALLDDLLRDAAKMSIHPPESPQVATILQTSGSSGGAKYVPHSMSQHEASAFASSHNIPVKPEDIWLCVLPLSHAGGISIVFRSMVYGSSIAMLEKFDAPRVLQIIQSMQIPHVSLVPTMLRRLLQEPLFQSEHLSSLKFILLGGARIESGLLDDATRRGFTILATYGMTETASQIATMNVYAPPEKRGSAGRPLPGMSVRITGESNEILPADMKGHIWVKGHTVLRGYYRQALDPEVFDGGWFKTGDTGSIDADGYLWIAQRSDAIIITGGENVDPAEVEAVLRQFPGVSDAAVVGLPDSRWGETVAAAIEAQSGSIDMAALRIFCKNQLASCKVPKKWLVLPTLPRTGSGKLARAEVRQLEFAEIP